MLTLFDEDKLTELRHGYQSSRLFCSLFPSLAYLEELYGELSPTQVWHEMDEFCASQLSGAVALEIEIIQLWNTLNQRYLQFVKPDGEVINRTPTKANYTAVCVMTCVCYRLISEPDEMMDINKKWAVEEILKIIGQHPIHIHLYLGQYNREDKLESIGCFIERNIWLNEADTQKTTKCEIKDDAKADFVQQQGFNDLYKKINLEDLKGWVKIFEAEINFKHKIDRLAYLVFSSQKGWLKAPRNMKIATWVNLFNSFLPKDLSMQQSEVSRKWGEFKDEDFYESVSTLRGCDNFSSEHVSLVFYKTLKENTLIMHTVYNIKNHQNSNGK